MSSSVADRQGARVRGATLVELVIVIVVSAILFIVTPILVFHGVKTLVFLPKALAVNHIATEAMHQVIEGGFSTLSGQTTIQGLRFAVRRSSSDPAIWFAKADSVGFLTSDGQYVRIRLVGNVIKKGVRTPSTTCTTDLSSLTEEDIPYHASGSVQIIPTG